MAPPARLFAARPVLGRLALGLVAATFATACLPIGPVGPAPSRLLAPPRGEYYQGVFPGGYNGWEADITSAQVSAYEHAAGRRAAWVYFSDNWFASRRFPGRTARWIRDRGSVPYIRLMLRSKVAPVEGPDPVYTLRRILDGDFDADFEAWGRGAAAFATPVIVEFGTEMNGDWFAWNGRWNGGRYGPRRFRAAYRHIVERIEAGGAHNITWVFHVNDTSVPDEWWNRFEAYYPGDRAVDWVAVSVYGAQSPLDDWSDDFVATMDEVVPRLARLAPGKPIIVAEFGVTGGHPDGKATTWANRALRAILSGRWPQVRGFSWWNERWQNDDDPDHDTDMRVQSVPGLSWIFRSRLRHDPDVIDRPILG